MTSRIVSFLALFFSLVALSGQRAPEAQRLGAQEPPKIPVIDDAPKPMPKAPLSYPRGRKAPKDEAELIKKMVSRPDHQHHLNRLKQHLAALPAEYDARTTGVISPAWDQSQCGSCWNFSGTRMCTTALVKSGVLTVDQTLSTQYTMDCYSNGGCNGDDNSTVCQQCMTSGLPTTASYGPYTASSGRCKSNPGPLLKIANWGYVGSQDGIPADDLIKAAIIQYGGVGTAVAAGGDWDNYQAGQVLRGGSTNIDHDVFILGWKKDPADATKFVWIVMNSWGPGWGDQGTCLMASHADSIGTSANWAVGPTAPPPASLTVTLPNLTSQVGQLAPFGIIITGGTAPYSAQWTYGDGQTGLVPNHAYATPGTFTVSVTASDSSKPPLTGTATATATISAPPPPPTPLTIGDNEYAIDPVAKTIRAGRNYTLSGGASNPNFLDVSGIDASTMDTLRKFIEFVRQKKAPALKMGKIP